MNIRFQSPSRNWFLKSIAGFILLVFTSVQILPQGWAQTQVIDYASQTDLQVKAVDEETPSQVSEPTMETTTDFLMSASSTLSATEEPVFSFSDDFGNGGSPVSDHWTEAKGTWWLNSGENGGRLEHDRPITEGRLIYNGALATDDYAIEVRVQYYDSFSLDGGRGLVARYQDSNNYYFAKAALNGYAEIVKIENGVKTVLGSFQGPAFDNSNYHDLKFLVYGDDLQFYVDGELWIAATDNALTTGQVGIGSDYYHVFFDDFRVTTVDRSVQPLPPAANLVPQYTNQTSLLLSGTKPANTSIWVNGVEVVPLDSSTEWSYQVPLSEGINSFEIVTKNTFGNASAVLNLSTMRDTQAPSGAIHINSGDPFSTSNQVTLNLLAEDQASGVNTMSFSTDGTNWTAPEAYSETKTFLLSEGDGLKTHYVKFYDRAGNESEVQSASITLDQTQPTGSLRINGGEQVAYDRAVRVDLESQDGVLPRASQMSFSTDGVDWTVPEPFQTSKTLTLEGESGPKTIYVRFLDEAGNTSEVYSASIAFIIPLPRGSIQINQGLTFATSRDVMLSLDAHPGTIPGDFNRDGSVDAADYIVARKAGSAEYDLWRANFGKSLPPLPGDYNRDGSVDAADYVLARKAGQAEYETWRANFGKTRAVTQMSFSTDGVNWTAPEAYQTSKSFTLDRGDGTKTIYVRFYDGLGNVSEVYSASVLLALPALPTGSIEINQGQSTTSNREVVLSLDARPGMVPGDLNRDGNVDAADYVIARKAGPSYYDLWRANFGKTAPPVTQMSFSQNGITWTTPEAYQTTKNFTLPAINGLKTVYVKFIDEAGNESQVYSAQISINPFHDIVFTSAPETEDPLYTLTYTVNGVPFEELRILDREGENILFVTKIDPAGNKTVAAHTVTLTPRFAEESFPSNGTFHHDAHIDTQDFKFEGGSLVLDGDRDYLSIPDHPDFDLSGGTWTIEAWIKPAVSYVYGMIYSQIIDNFNTFFIAVDSNNAITLNIVEPGSTINFSSRGGVISPNVWTHIAVQEEGSLYKIYINGVQEGELDSAQRPLNYTDNVQIGRWAHTDHAASTPFSGWIDELRVSNGVARYPSDFSLPTEEYRRDPETKLLFHFSAQGSRPAVDAAFFHKDARTDTVESRFGGGSLALDGDGDYLSVPDHPDFDFAASDFTIDFWVKLNALKPTAFFTKWIDTNNKVQFYWWSETGGAPGNYLALDTTLNGSSATWIERNWMPNTNQWYHIALVRAGDQFSIFVDGIQLGATAANSNALPSINADVRIGSRNSDLELNGWMDEFRVSKGIARWTSNFPPPTDEYLPDLDTKLLLHFTPGVDVPYDSPESPFNLITENGEILQYIQNQLGQITLPDGSLLNQLQLDSDGNLTDAFARLSDGSLQVLQNGNQIIYRRPDGSHYYYEEGELTKVVTKDGLTILYSYLKDALGNILEIMTESDEFKTIYDAQGRIKSSLDKLTAELREFQDGILTKIIACDGSDRVYSSAVQGTSIVVTLSYQMVVPIGVPNSCPGSTQSREVSYYSRLVYDAATGTLEEAEDEDGNIFTFEDGLLKEVRDPQGNLITVESTESAFANLLNLTMTQNDVTAGYDEEGKLSTVSVGGLTIHYEKSSDAIDFIETEDGSELYDLVFDSEGNLSGARIIDSQNVTRVYQEGRLIHTIEADQTEIFFNFDQIIKLITPDKFVYNFSYTPGTITAELDSSFIPEPETVVRIEYGEDLNLKKIIKQNDEIISFLDNQLFQIEVPGEAVKVYTYEKDGDGNVISTTITQGNVETFLDQNNQPIRTLIHPTEQNPHAFEVLYAYGKIREVYKNGSLAFRYSYQFPDGVEQTVIEELEEGVTKVVKVYQDESLLTSFDVETSVLSTYSYYSFGETGSSGGGGAFFGGIINIIGNMLRNLGKVSQVRVSRLGRTLHTYDYTYDGENTIVTDESGVKRTYNEDHKLIFLEREGDTFAYDYFLNDQGQEIIEERLISRKLSDGSTAHYDEKGQIESITLLDGSILTDIVLNERREVVKATLNQHDGTKLIFGPENTLLEKILPGSDGVHFYYENGRVSKVVDPILGELAYSYEEDQEENLQFIWVKKGEANLKYDLQGNLIGLRLSDVPVVSAGTPIDFYDSSFHDFSGGRKDQNGPMGMDGNDATSHSGYASCNIPGNGDGCNDSTTLVSTHNFDQPYTLTSIDFKALANASNWGRYHLEARARYWIDVFREGAWQNVKWESSGGNGAASASFDRDLKLENLNLTGVTAVRITIDSGGNVTGGYSGVSAQAYLYEFYAEVQAESGADPSYLIFSPAADGYQFQGGGGTFAFDSAGNVIGTYTAPTLSTGFIQPFLESSPYRRYVKREGDVSLNSTDLLFDNTNAYFDGQNDSLYLQDNDDWDLRSEDFQIEGNFLFKSLPQTGQRMTLIDYGAGYQGGLPNGFRISLFNNQGESQIHLKIGESNYYLDWTPELNQFHHIALKREGLKFKLFINGAQMGEPIEQALSVTGLSDGLRIGAAWENVSGFQAANFFHGLADEIRLQKGASSVNPSRPESRYTPDSNTVLLLHFDDETYQAFKQGEAARESLNGAVQLLTTLPYFNQLEAELNPNLESLFETAREAVLDFQTVVAQEYSQEGVLETQTKADGTITLFDDQNRPTMVMDEEGTVLVEYGYDGDDPILIRLRNARDALPDEIARTEAKIEEQRVLYLLDIAEAGKKAYQDIKATFDPLKEPLYFYIQVLEGQLAQIGAVDARGKDMRQAKSEALNSVRNQLNQVYGQLRDLIKAEADAYARIDDEMRIASEKVVNDATAALTEIRRQEVELKKEILRQETSPLVYHYYRKTLGRDPSQAEYEYWIEQVDYDSGNTEEEILTKEGVPLTQAIKDHFNQLPELLERQEYVQEIKEIVTTEITNYLALSQSQREAYAEALGIVVGGEEPELINLTESDAQKILEWLNSRSLHFGQSAFLTLEYLLDQKGIGYDREELAAKVILIDILAGVITPLDQGDILLSVYALTKTASLYGLTLSGAKLTFDELKALYRSVCPSETDPCSLKLMAHIGGNHFVLITQVKDSEVTYIDTGIGKDKENDEVTVTEEGFLSVWKGYVALEDEVIDTHITTHDPRISVQEAMSIRGAFWGSLLRLIGFILRFTPLAPIAIVFDIAALVIDIVKGDWLSAIASAVAIAFQGFDVGKYFHGTFTGIKDAFSSIGSFFSGLFQPVRGFLEGAVNLIPGFKTLTSSPIFNQVLNYSIQAGVSYGVSKGLVKLGVLPEISGFLGGLVSGVVLGGTEKLTETQINAGITHSSLIKKNVLGQILLNDVGSLGLELGLNPVFSSIMGLSLGAIQGQTILNPSISLERAFQNVLPNLLGSFSLYGISSLGTSLGLDPRISSLIGLPFGALVTQLTDGFVNPNGGGGPGDIFNRVGNAISSVLRSIGFDFGGQTTHPLFGSLDSGSIISSIQSVLGLDNLFPNLFNIIQNTILNPFNLVNGVVQTVFNGITNFSSLIQERGLIGAFESLASSIFSRKTLEDIFKGGGIGGILGSAVKTLTTLVTGQQVQELKLSNSDSLFFDMADNFIGKLENGILQLGTFGINALGKFALITGRVIAAITGLDNFVFAANVANNGQFMNGAISGPNGTIIELNPEGGEGPIVIKGPGPDDNGGSFWNVLFKLLPLALDLFFKGGNLNNAQVTLPTVSNPGSIISSTTNPVYVLANGIANTSATQAPAYIQNLKADLKTQSQLDPTLPDITDKDLLDIPLYPPMTQSLTGNKLIDMLKWVWESQTQFIHGTLTGVVKTILGASGLVASQRPIVAMGYSGGLLPLIEGLASAPYNVASIVGLGAATATLRRDILDILLAATKKIEKVMAGGSLSFLDGLLSGLTSIPILGSLFGFINETINVITSSLQAGLVEPAFQALRNLVQRITSEIPEAIAPFPSLAASHAELLVNVWGTEDILYELGIAGPRENLAGLPTINIEIVGATHFDYMRRSETDPNPPDDWNRSVSDFVTRLMQNSKTTTDLEAFLSEKGVVPDSRGVWVVTL